MFFQQLKLLGHVSVLGQSLHAAFPFEMRYQIQLWLKKQNLSPPFWSLLCFSHSHSAMTSRKLQAINSTRCSPLLQLCLGNSQPCQAHFHCSEPAPVAVTPTCSSAHLQWCKKGFSLTKIKSPAFPLLERTHINGLLSLKVHHWCFLGWEHLFTFWDHSSPVNEEHFWAS